MWLIALGHRARRQALERVLDPASRPGWHVPGPSHPPRQVGVAQSALRMRLPSNSGPADVGYALERLARTARACREGLDRPVAEQLVEADWREAAAARPDPPTRALGIVEAGIDRIRGELDPALAGQLKVIDDRGGDLSLAAAHGGLTRSDGPREG